MELFAISICHSVNRKTTTFHSLRLINPCYGEMLNGEHQTLLLPPSSPPSMDTEVSPHITTSPYATTIKRKRYIFQYSYTAIFIKAKCRWCLLSQLRSNWHIKIIPTIDTASSSFALQLLHGPVCVGLCATYGLILLSTVINMFLDLTLTLWYWHVLKL